LSLLMVKMKVRLGKFISALNYLIEHCAMRTSVNEMITPFLASVIDD
jgi:hypothetical protein